MLILKTDCGDRVELVPHNGGWTVADALYTTANKLGDAYGEFLDYALQEVNRGESDGLWGTVGFQVVQGVESAEVGGRWQCWAGLQGQSTVVGYGDTEDEARANYAKRQPVPEADALREEFLKIIQADDDENEVLLLAWENLMGTECEFAPIPELLDLFNAVRA